MKMTQMKHNLSEKIIHKIEAICAQGCGHVNRLLEAAKNGAPVEELNEFSESEINQIINELEQIMSVYDNNSCTPDE